MNVTFDKSGRAIRWGKRRPVELTAKVTNAGATVHLSGGRTLTMAGISSLSAAEARSAFQAAARQLGDRTKTRAQKNVLRKFCHALDERLEAIAAADAPAPRVAVLALSDRVAAARHALGISAMDHRPPEFRERSALAGLYARRAPNPPPRVPPAAPEDPRLVAARTASVRRALFGGVDESVKARAAEIRKAMGGA